jgi:hypothetical protein
MLEKRVVARLDFFLRVKNASAVWFKPNTADIPRCFHSPPAVNWNEGINALAEQQQGTYNRSIELPLKRIGFQFNDYTLVQYTQKENND